MFTTKDGTVVLCSCGLVVRSPPAAAAGRGVPAEEHRAPQLVPRRWEWSPERPTLGPRAGRYVEARRIYDEALEKPAQYLVAVDKSRGLRTGASTSWRRLRPWRERGRPPYRRRADSAGGHLFWAPSGIGTRRGSERLVDQYPFQLRGRRRAGPHRRTSASTRAITPRRRRAGPLLDRDGGATARWSSRASCSPGPRAGRKGAPRDLILRVDRDPPGAKVQVGGNEVALAEYLKGLATAVLAQPADAAPLALPSWGMISGGPAGSRWPSRASSSPRPPGWTSSGSRGSTARTSS
jgi:hypothetical protein